MYERIFESPYLMAYALAEKYNTHFDELVGKTLDVFIQPDEPMIGVAVSDSGSYLTVDPNELPHPKCGLDAIADVFVQRLLVQAAQDFRKNPNKPVYQIKTLGFNKGGEPRPLRYSDQYFQSEDTAERYITGTLHGVKFDRGTLVSNFSNNPHVPVTCNPLITYGRVDGEHLYEAFYIEELRPHGERYV